MSQFKKNLESLPSVDHLAGLEVCLPSALEAVVAIENKPGKSGSLAVYSYLKDEFGEMTSDAAKRGLELFGEYAEEARSALGSHPNIDFLFKVIDEGGVYQVNVKAKSLYKKPRC